MNLAAFYISSPRHIFRKLLAVPENSVEIRARSHGTLLVILLTSSVISKQRLLYKNKIAQCHQNGIAITLAKNILGSLIKSYKAHKKQPRQFSKAVHF